MTFSEGTQPHEDVSKRKKRRRKEKNLERGRVADAADRCTEWPAVSRNKQMDFVIHKNRENIVYKSIQKYYSTKVFIINRKI